MPVKNQFTKLQEPPQQPEPQSQSVILIMDTTIDTIFLPSIDAVAVGHDELKKSMQALTPFMKVISDYLRPELTSAGYISGHLEWVDGYAMGGNTFKKVLVLYNYREQILIDGASADDVFEMLDNFLEKLAEELDMCRALADDGFAPQITNDHEEKKRPGYYFIENRALADMVQKVLAAGGTQQYARSVRMNLFGYESREFDLPKRRKIVREDEPYTGLVDVNYVKKYDNVFGAIMLEDGSRQLEVSFDGKYRDELMRLFNEENDIEVFALNPVTNEHTDTRGAKYVLGKILKME